MTRLQASLLLGLLTLGPPSSAESLPVRARAAGAYNLDTGEWLFSRDLDSLVPIASITKVMAALAFVTSTDDLDQIVTIQEADWVGAGRTALRVGDRVSARTLLDLALVSSDNCAARALAHPMGLTPEGYGYRMLLSARSMGLWQSRFVEPSGLDERNVSTAREVAHIFAAALRHPVLREILGTPQLEVSTPRGTRRVRHSSQLLRNRDDVVAAKTGYLDEAGYCLVQCATDSGGDIITVVLGAPSRRWRNTSSERVLDFARKRRNLLRS